MIISIHIEKTAGTTFADLIYRNFGEQQACLFTNKCPSCGRYFHSRMAIDGKLHSPEQVECSTHLSFTDIMDGLAYSKHPVKIIHGHIAVEDIVSLHDKFFTQVITWLRNPEARYVSHYRMLERDGVVKTWLDYQVQERYHNVMTGTLKGLPLSKLSFIGIVENMIYDVQEIGLFKDTTINILNSFKYDNYKSSSTYFNNRRDVELYNTVCSLRGLDRLII